MSVADPDEPVVRGWGVTRRHKARRGFEYGASATEQMRAEGLDPQRLTATGS